MVMNINTCTSLSSQVRQAADKKYLTAAQRMANRYNRKKCVKSFGVGDKVSERIPRIDLGYHVVYIVEVLGGVQGVYCLNFEFLYGGMTFFYYLYFRSEHGILSTCYPASQLEDFGGPFVVNLMEGKR